MAMDFVSEVDRKFFANNLLTSDDWDSSMDIENVVTFDPDFSPDDFVKELPDDLGLPVDPVDLSLFSSHTHDDLLHDWSDSSDSGVSGVAAPADISSPTITIKDEPLSPAFSNHSDSSDSLLQAPCLPLTDTVKEESQRGLLDVSIPTNTQVFSFPVKQENVSPTLLLGPQSAPPINIHSILNSKVKIQPKPETDAMKPTTAVKTSTVTGTGNQKSLVLTAQEFARLTSQGVLRFKPPKQESGTTAAPSTGPVLQQTSQQCQQLAPIISSPTTTVPMSGSSLLGAGIEDKDCKILKRQQRMIKNRESASLSRRKKKEYLSTLESRLKEFSAENQRLKNENINLKRKVTELHSENESLKKSFVSKPVKKTCLLAVVLLFSLNLVPWSGIILRAPSSARDDMFNVPTVNKGRQLMSVKEGSEGWGVLSGDTIDKLHDIIFEYKRQENNSNPLYTCPTHFNRTESMRLAEQLAGWMYRHEEEKRKEFKKKERRVNKEKQVRPISTLKAAMRGDIRVMDKNKFRMTENRYQLQIFDGEDTGRDFLKTIHRRNDTFYVLSFDTNYYLVPAVAHNKTMRPRMSLVMPAVALNESMAPPAGRVGMMQIDCEVVNTQLIHVQKSALPKHYRNKNTTFTRFEEQKEGGSFYP